MLTVTHYPYVSSSKTKPKPCQLSSVQLRRSVHALVLYKIALYMDRDGRTS